MKSPTYFSHFATDFLTPFHSQVNVCHLQLGSACNWVTHFFIAKPLSQNFKSYCIIISGQQQTLQNIQEKLNPAAGWQTLNTKSNWYWTVQNTNQFTKCVLKNKNLATNKTPSTKMILALQVWQNQKASRRKHATTHSALITQKLHSNGCVETKTHNYPPFFSYFWLSCSFLSPTSGRCFTRGSSQHHQHPYDTTPRCLQKMAILH